MKISDRNDVFVDLRDIFIFLIILYNNQKNNVCVYEKVRLADFLTECSYKYF